MNKKLAILGVIIAAIITCITVWAYLHQVDYRDKTAHSTERWTVISDSKNEIIAVETTRNEIWNVLVELHQNQTERWIGGSLETYNNKWGFRFKPDTIIIAQITIEGAQSNIQGISENLNYWIDTWGKEVYVLAKVVEIHK